jgi:hypothetical protein
LLLVAIFLAMELFTILFTSGALGRSTKPILIYSNGMEFYLFALDKLRRRTPFVLKADITEASTGGIPGGAPTASGFNIRTRSDVNYYSGERAEEDVRSVLEFLHKEWGIRVLGLPEAKARKIRTETEPEPWGTLTANSMVRAPFQDQQDQVDVPPMFCPSCGASAVKEYDFCPHCGHKFGMPVARYQQVVIAPPPEVIEPPRPEPESKLPSYLQKNPRLAFLLGLLPGAFCIMGLGHFYTKRYVKGVVLLFVGFFLGAFAYVALFEAFTPNEYGLTVNLFTAVILAAPFVAVLLWQAFDASNQAKRFNATAAAPVQQPYEALQR